MKSTKRGFFPALRAFLSSFVGFLSRHQSTVTINQMRLSKYLQRDYVRKARQKSDRERNERI